MIVCVLIWIIGFLFTLEIMYNEKNDGLSFLHRLAILIFWPIILGCEIKDILIDIKKSIERKTK